MSNPQENAQESLDNARKHEAPLQTIEGSAAAPALNGKIYLKSPFRETHVELQVTRIDDEENPATGVNETAYTFHDGSKLYQSDLDGADYTWTPIPEVAASIDNVKRKDEDQEEK